MNTIIRIKSLNGNTFTYTVIKDGKTFINVYNEEGNVMTAEHPQHGAAVMLMAAIPTRRWGCLRRQIILRGVVFRIR